MSTLRIGSGATLTPGNAVSIGTTCTKGSLAVDALPVFSIRSASAAVAVMTASARSRASSGFGPVAVTLRMTDSGATEADTRAATWAGVALMPVASMARCATARPVTSGRYESALVPPRVVAARPSPEEFWSPPTTT